MCWSRAIPGVDDFQTSAVLEAVMLDTKVDIHAPAVMICTSLPTVMEFNSLYNSDIREIHFIGELDKPDSVAFLNKLSKASPQDGFRIVQLSVEK